MRRWRARFVATQVAKALRQCGGRLREERGALQRQAPVSRGVRRSDCVGLDALLVRSLPDQKMVFGRVQVAPVGKTAQIALLRELELLEKPNPLILNQTL